jgi:hypothetical protein
LDLAGGELPPYGQRPASAKLAAYGSADIRLLHAGHSPRILFDHVGKPTDSKWSWCLATATDVHPRLRAGMASVCGPDALDPQVLRVGASGPPASTKLAEISYADI